jgi:hypothetical protein
LQRRKQLILVPTTSLVEQLKSDFEDYSMKERTYRYMDEALFPFGFGLSYTEFEYSSLQVESPEFIATSTALQSMM